MTKPDTTPAASASRHTPELKYGMIQISKRTFAVMIETSFCAVNARVGHPFRSYALCTKPISYSDACECLRRMANKEPFLEAHAHWFPDDAKLDRQYRNPFKDDALAGMNPEAVKSCLEKLQYACDYPLAMAQNSGFRQEVHAALAALKESK